MKAIETKIAGIDTLEVSGENKEVGVILIHGYGASMHDLFPLWEMWHQEGFNWYFPNGVLPLPGAYFGGRAWFSIDIAALEEAMRTGKLRDMKNNVPAEFDSTLAALETFVQEVSKRHKKLIIGGFSQGAMCSSHLAMNEKLNLDGLILMSGALIAQDKFPERVGGLPFYQSHGTQDQILSIQGGKDLHEKLGKLGFLGEFHEFRGGHEIPTSVLHGVKDFLKKFTV